jgi:hypothetical protein
LVFYNILHNDRKVIEHFFKIFFYRQGELAVKEFYFVLYLDDGESLHVPIKKKVGILYLPI